jgi:hypothetical protein
MIPSQNSAGGNAALAYKYLQHIEKRKFLQSFYDFS